jgi:hypothetical protein
LGEDTRVQQRENEAKQSSTLFHVDGLRYSWQRYVKQ